KSFSHIIGLDLTNLGNKYSRNISESLHSAQVSFAAPHSPECGAAGFSLQIQHREADTAKVRRV
ncbi:hypothetical protein, partial [Alistipes finegoldii]|uniref:hypothetical protein n=1 Tax=Alistipes finegoldii TaxID=214856 RepID=UPI00242DCF1B